MISGYVRIAADLTMANDEVRCAIDRNHVYCAGLEAESDPKSTELEREQARCAVLDIRS